MVTKQDVLKWLHRYAEVLAEQKDYLTQLDAAIGDADHGINMDRGFQAVIAQLPGVEDKDIGAILKKVGMVLVSTVGGAGGPLYGTLFLRMGMTVNGKEALSAEDVLKMFEAALDGVKQRGKAQVGDKTMVDAITPAVEALRDALAAGDDLRTALEKATAAAEEGMKATIPMVARKGRASYLGERSAGHQDPGATSSFYLFKCAQETWTS